MKKKLLATMVVVGMIFVSTAGADVNLSVSTTAAQDAKLAKVLTWVNTSRETPFADVDAMLLDLLIRETKQLIREVDEREHKAIFEAWEAADESTKDRVKNLLGVP